MKIRLIHLQHLLLGMFLLSCVLGSATALRNLSVVLLLALNFSSLFVVDKRVKAVYWLVALFVLAALPAAYASHNFHDVITLARDCLFCLILMSVGLKYGGDREKFRFAILAQAIVMGVLAVLAVSSAMLSSLPSNLAVFVGHWYPWYGVASTLVIMLMPLAFIALQQSEGGGDRRSSVGMFLSVSLLLIFICVENRMALFVAALALILPAIVLMKGRKRMLLVLMILTVCSLLFLYKANQRFGNLQDIETGASSSMLEKALVNDPRISGWSYWIEKSYDEMPWYGFGLSKRNLAQVVSERERQDARLWDPAMATHGHNMVLNIWLRSGYPGLLAFVGLGFFLLRLFFREGKNGNVYALAGGGMVLLFFLKNMTDDFFEAPLSLLLFFWVGVFYRRIWELQLVR